MSRDIGNRVLPLDIEVQVIPHLGEEAAFELAFEFTDDKNAVDMVGEKNENEISGYSHFYAFLWAFWNCGARYPRSPH